MEYNIIIIQMMLLHLYMSLVIVIHVAMLLRNRDSRVVWSLDSQWPPTITCGDNSGLTIRHDFVAS